MRKSLDALYTASGWLAGLCMIGVLLMVVLTILGRVFNFSVHGADAYAGYTMAGAGFLALASTLKHGEHIRVTLLLSMTRGRGRRAMELAALLVAVILSGFLALYAIRLAWQSWLYQDISTGLDATPLWIPQISMILGTLIFFIAFLDEFCLELLGRRHKDAAEEPHHE
uniref:TRAP transporter small permease n=1 Tax=Castellaniella defragrans TaxID=75697 RepID=UPI00333FCD59